VTRARPLALTRAVSATLAHCELTHVARSAIDVARARAQHAQLERALADAGCALARLPPLDDQPDAVFVEDCAVVLPELGIVARPGASSRRSEVDSVARALAAHRPLARIEPPATLDGGDVLALGRTLWVGLSRRTNLEAVRQLRTHVAPHGYEVHGLAIEGALHLKTAATRAAPGVLVVNPEWVPPARFAGWDVVPVDPREPFAANVLHVNGATLCAAAHPRTNERLAARGARVVALAVDELAKAEGGLTCCALLVSPHA
jgi:dimethylargininase